MGQLEHMCKQARKEPGKLEDLNQLERWRRVNLNGGSGPAAQSCSISAKGKDALSSNTEGEGERRELKQKC